MKMMTERITACITLLLLGHLVFATIRIAPTDPDIRYTGRWNFDDPLLPWVGWQGSSIEVNFEGSGLRMEMGGDKTEQFRVIIDGVPETARRYIFSDKGSYVLAENLSDGIHHVEVFKETFNGKSFFYGLEVTGNGLLPLPERPSLRIEFFGDSNMDGSSNYSEKNEGDMGTYYAFPAMLTRMLGAEMNNQSVSGARLYGTGNNCVGSFIFSEDYYQQDPEYRSGFDPHIILVNAGANDIWESSKSQIKQKFRSVIADLRSVYGTQVQIVLMNGYGWDTREPAIFSQEVVDELGDPGLSVCLFPWLWEQWHGSQWDHSGQAHILLDHISSLNPEWSQVHPSDIIDGFGRDGGLTNGSFEHVAPFGGFGWRYFEDGVERIHDQEEAADGAYYIRLNEGEEVHQPTDATADFLPGATLGGELYEIRARIRGVEDGARAEIVSDFQGQQIWNRGDPQSSTFDVTREWKTYIASSIAPAGSWTMFTTLRSVSGAVEFDSVSLRTIVPGNPGTTNTPGNDSFEHQDQEGSVFPNPVTVDSVLSFVYAGEGPLLLQIYSIYGSLEKEMVFPSGRISFSASELGLGLHVYRIIASCDQSVTSGRFIVH